MKAATLLLLAFWTAALAKTVHAPLPDKLLQAKTVYIDNQSNFAVVTDQALEELTKWGRFSIVSDKSKADVAFIFTAVNRAVGSSPTSATEVGTSVLVENKTVYDCSTTLTVVDPKGVQESGRTRENAVKGAPPGIS